MEREIWELRSIAIISEPDCIGCTLCIAACPVDAIVGAAQFSHTIIANECTGCELCLAPCPVDCISIVAKKAPRRQARLAKQRFAARNERLTRQTTLREAELAAQLADFDLPTSNVALAELKSRITQTDTADKTADEE